MKKATTTTKPQTTKGQTERIQDPAVMGNPLKANSKWSAVQHVRLPHKVGLPLGSGGCGDAIER
jgi:hypothetical protein